VTEVPEQSPPPPAPAPVATTDKAAAAPAATDAVIVFANIPGTQCGACETLKISVTPSGSVLIERGHWDSGHTSWHYERSKAQVGPARAADFAGRVGAYRAAGDQTLAGGPACPEPVAEDDGLTIEWVAAGQYDQARFNFGCPARRASQLADTLRHAPDVLGLRQLVFPWSKGG
jgi:hypothetical protein